MLHNISRNKTIAVQWRRQTERRKQTEPPIQLVNSATVYQLIKLTWIFQAAVLYILLGTLIFSGIEGNSAKVRKYALLMEQEKFNKSNRGEWKISDFDKFYYKSVKVSKIRCELAKLDMFGWEKMHYLDAFIFSYSLISTTGWTFRPQTSSLRKASCMVYGFIGIPVFATLIGLIVKMIKADEGEFKTSSFVRKCFGNYKICFMFGLILCLLFLVAQGYAMTKLVEYYSEDMREEYGKVGLPAEWSITEGIYFFFINGISLVGFGDQYMVTSARNMIGKLANLVFNICLLVWVIASLVRAFPLVRRYLNHSLDKKMSLIYEETANSNIKFD
ncbi:hypothetical protein ACHWQZ_G016825 [Mnemiopsis leidyi]